MPGTPPTTVPWVPLWPLTPQQGVAIVAEHKITAPVTVTGTTSAAPTECIPGAPITYEAVEHEFEFYCPGVTTGDAFRIGLYDGNTLVAQLSEYSETGGGQTGSPVHAKIRFTPSAGVHTYNIKAWAGAATRQMFAGTGIAGYAPAYLRITKGQVWPITSPPGAPGYGTGFPAGTPADGAEHILTDSLTVPTYAWRFRYVAGITDAYKWVFIGGAAAFREVVTLETSASTAYTALATAGPSFAIPVAGIYQVRVAARVDNTSNDGVMRMSYDIGATPAVDADAAIGMVEFANHPSNAMRIREKTIAAAGNITAKYRTDGGTGRWEARMLEVTPVRLAA